MPFKSEAQRRWMWLNHPEMAARWEAHTPKGKKLPKYVRKYKRRYDFDDEGWRTGIEIGKQESMLGTKVEPLRESLLRSQYGPSFDLGRRWGRRHKFTSPNNIIAKAAGMWNAAKMRVLPNLTPLSAIDDYEVF